MTSPSVTVVSYTYCNPLSLETESHQSVRPQIIITGSIGITQNQRSTISFIKYAEATVNLPVTTHQQTTQFHSICLPLREDLLTDLTKSSTLSNSYSKINQIADLFLAILCPLLQGC